MVFTYFHTIDASGKTGDNEQGTNKLLAAFKKVESPGI